MPCGGSTPRAGRRPSGATASAGSTWPTTGFPGGCSNTTRIAALDGLVDADAVTAVWQTALDAPRSTAAEVVRGDPAPGNLLAVNGVRRGDRLRHRGRGQPACRHDRRLAVPGLRHPRGVSFGTRGGRRHLGPGPSLGTDRVAALRARSLTGDPVRAAVPGGAWTPSSPPPCRDARPDAAEPRRLTPPSPTWPGCAAGPPRCRAPSPARTRTPGAAPWPRAAGAAWAWPGSG